MRMPRSSGALLLLVAALWACGRADTPAATPASSAPPTTPSSREISVEANSVVMRGRWQPADAGSTAANNVSVSVTCTRSEKRCREELKTPGQEGKPELADYAVREWTATKLVASRRTSVASVELRVAFTAAAAEKVVIQKRSGKTVETHWRLE